jgi:26S proteasome regulatory subunit N3
VKAVQLNYAEAQANVLLALRKASEIAGKAFRLAATKLQIIIELLMGEIPDREMFNNHEMKTALAPYFVIVQKVREGALDEFSKLVVESKDLFLEDGNFNLINRLRHNVIKFGLRKINLSYSKISLADVTSKLGLDSIEDTECIVAKAIRDGVIEAQIDHQKSHLMTREVVDIYTSNEPQQVFDKRIKFCMELYNKSQQGLEFAKEEEKKDIFKNEGDPDTAENEMLDDLIEEFDEF